MELHGSNLEEHLSRAKNRSEIRPFLDKYTALKHAFEEHVHPYATPGAISVDRGHLTDHGPKHIATVIAKASEITQNLSGPLSYYEVFMLLFGIQIHDIGNMLGRAKHERTANEVIDLVIGGIAVDQIARRMAYQIASTHGGTINGDKDTITALQPTAIIHNQPLRPRLLASILRLADELAEEPARANVVMLRAGKLPKQSEVYHAYASGLHTSACSNSEGKISLLFQFQVQDFVRQFGKGRAQVYLFDEIVDRSLKTFAEARYCSRFLRPFSDYHRVAVVIEIYDENNREMIKPVTFHFEEAGYREYSISDLPLIAPDFRAYRVDGQQLNGARLSVQLRKKLKEMSEASKPNG